MILWPDLTNTCTTLGCLIRCGAMQVFVYPHVIHLQNVLSVAEWKWFLRTTGRASVTSKLQEMSLQNHKRRANLIGEPWSHGDNLQIYFDYSSRTIRTLDLFWPKFHLKQSAINKLSCEHVTPAILAKDKSELSNASSHATQEWNAQNLHNSMTRMMDAEEAGMTVIRCQDATDGIQCSRNVPENWKAWDKWQWSLRHFATANSSSCHLHSIIRSLCMSIRITDQLLCLQIAQNKI